MKIPRISPRITISSVMFELFTDIESDNEQDQEVLDAISSLDQIKIIISDNGEDGKAMHEDAIKKPGSEYEVLMTVEDKDEDLTFFIKENDGTIEETSSHRRADWTIFFIMSLLGEIDLRQISKLAGSMQIEGIDNLDELDK